MTEALTVTCGVLRIAKAVRAVGKRAALLDALDGTLFALRSSRQRAAYCEFSSLSSPSSFVSFAQVQFPGPFSQLPEEILPFLDYAAGFSPRRVSEIGTQFGGTNFLLSQGLPTVTTMVGIDLFVRNRARLEAFCKPGQILHFIDGSSHEEETKTRLALALEDAELDLLFIDGDHTWSGVVQDFLFYRALVADGGLIAFHDVVPDERLRHGRSSMAFAGEVPIFWSRLKDHFRHQEFVRDWNQEGCGIGVIEYDRSVSLPDALFMLT